MFASLLFSSPSSLCASCLKRAPRNRGHRPSKGCFGAFTRRTLLAFLGDRLRIADHPSSRVVLGRFFCHTDTPSPSLSHLNNLGFRAAAVARDTLWPFSAFWHAIAEEHRWPTGLIKAGYAVIKCFGPPPLSQQFALVHARDSDLLFFSLLWFIGIS